MIKNFIGCIAIALVVALTCNVTYAQGGGGPGGGPGGEGESPCNKTLAEVQALLNQLTTRRDNLADSMQVQELLTTHLRGSEQNVINYYNNTYKPANGPSLFIENTLVILDNHLDSAEFSLFEAGFDLSQANAHLALANQYINADPPDYCAAWDELQQMATDLDAAETHIDHASQFNLAATATIIGLWEVMLP